MHAAQFRVLFNRPRRPVVVAVAPETIDLPAAEQEGTGPVPPPVPVPVAPPAPAYPGMHCVQHAGVAATAQCQGCGAYMCATCDFLLPGGIHLCPACATKTETGLSPKRKRALIGASVIAVWCTVWMALIVTGAFARVKMNVNLLGWIFILTVLIPSITGLTWGLGAINRRLTNPPLLWVATIWNAVILGGFLLLSVIGSMRR
jgi:hypothetical protein